MNLTPVSSSYEDIRGVPSMQSCYSAGMKRCGICMEERSPLWVRRSKSEETLCRLLITMVEETFDIRRSWVDHGRPVMNLKSGYVEGENSKWKVKQRKMTRLLDHHSSIFFFLFVSFFCPIEQVLLELDVPCHPCNFDKKKPMELAEKNGHDKCVKLLGKYSSSNEFLWRVKVSELSTVFEISYRRIASDSSGDMFQLGLIRLIRIGKVPYMTSRVDLMNSRNSGVDCISWLYWCIFDILRSTIDHPWNRVSSFVQNSHHHQLNVHFLPRSIKGMLLIWQRSAIKNWLLM